MRFNAAMKSIEPVIMTMRIRIFWVRVSMGFDLLRAIPKLIEFFDKCSD
jgi:hypothetical protein